MDKASGTAGGVGAGGVGPPGGGFSSPDDRPPHPLVCRGGAPDGEGKGPRDDGGGLGEELRRPDEAALRGARIRAGKRYPESAPRDAEGEAPRACSATWEELARRRRDLVPGGRGPRRDLGRQALQRLLLDALLPLRGLVDPAIPRPPRGAGPCRPEAGAGISASMPGSTSRRSARRARRASSSR